MGAFFILMQNAVKLLFTFKEIHGIFFLAEEQCSSNVQTIYEVINISSTESMKMVEIAIDILNYLADHGGSIGPREISRKFNIGSTSAQRIVTALERKSCLYFDEASQKYQFGYGVIRLIQGALDNIDIVQIAKSHLTDLQDEVGETICLHTLVENKRMTLFQVESKHELRWTANVGKLYPIHIGASGKVILAYLDKETIDDIISELEVDRQREVLSDLDQIKKEGFSVSYGERVAGGIGIAVPLFFNHKIYSISIFAPGNRVSKEDEVKFTGLLQKTASIIENQYVKL